jgi:hypothetical protein
VNGIDTPAGPVLDDLAEEERQMDERKEQVLAPSCKIVRYTLPGVCV